MPMQLSVPPIESKVLSYNGYSIHYFTTGKIGNPLLIMLHAAFCNHHCFDGQLGYFSQNFRVVTLDLLGHGLSAVDKTADTIASTNRHLCDIMETEGYSKAHILGASMGSLLAQSFAIEHPEKVETLTVLGGYNLNPIPAAIKRAQFTEGLKWIFRALVSMNTFRKYVAKMSAHHVESQQAIFEMAKQFHFKSFKAMRGLGDITKLRPEQQIRCPLLIVCGQFDIELAVSEAHRWHGTQPNSKLMIIKNAGHLANMDNPDEFNAHLMAFINESQNL